MAGSRTAYHSPFGEMPLVALHCPQAAPLEKLELASAVWLLAAELCRARHRRRCPDADVRALR